MVVPTRHLRTGPILPHRAGLIASSVPRLILLNFCPCLGLTIGPFPLSPAPCTKDRTTRPFAVLGYPRTVNVRHDDNIVVVADALLPFVTPHIPERGPIGFNMPTLQDSIVIPLLTILEAEVRPLDLLMSPITIILGKALTSCGLLARLLKLGPTLPVCFLITMILRCRVLIHLVQLVSMRLFFREWPRT